MEGETPGPREPQLWIRRWPRQSTMTLFVLMVLGMLATIICTVSLAVHKGNTGGVVFFVVLGPVMFVFGFAGCFLTANRVTGFGEGQFQFSNSRRRLTVRPGEVRRLLRVWWWFDPSGLFPMLLISQQGRMFLAPEFVDEAQLFASLAKANLNGRFPGHPAFRFPTRTR